VKGHGTLRRKASGQHSESPTSSIRRDDRSLRQCLCRVRIWPFISVIGLFDVENRGKRANDNKHHGVGKMSAGADPFSKSKYLLTGSSRKLPSGLMNLHALWLKEINMATITTELVGFGERDGSDSRFSIQHSRTTLCTGAR
jgi:hypothetical protein